MSCRPLSAAASLLLLACSADPTTTTTTGSSSGGPDTTTTTTASPASTTDLPDPTTSAGSVSDGQTTGTTGGVLTGTTTSTSTTGTSTSTTADSSTSSGTTDEPGTTGTTGAASELTLEHMQVKGTHNSYHLKPLIPFDKSHDYSHVPLDQQLESQGVRAFELDVHKGLADFEVYHISVIDAVSTCDLFGGCLGTIKGWSDLHPQHLPITIWIEIKDSTGGATITASDLDKLDELIRGVFPDDKLLTPDDIQGAFPSVHDALASDGWPTIDSLRGQVMVVLLNVDDEHASDYTLNYTTLAGRAMFARVTPQQFDLPWAAIAKLGAGDAADIAAAHDAHLLIATNVCGAGEADDACFMTLDTATSAGIHMLKDDFPAKVGNKTYWMDFADGNPARCNPVTAPPECTSAALEDL